jgi:hypothetical protein
VLGRHVTNSGNPPTYRANDFGSAPDLCLCESHVASDTRRCMLGRRVGRNRSHLTLEGRNIRTMRIGAPSWALIRTHAKTCVSPTSTEVITLCSVSMSACLRICISMSECLCRHVCVSVSVCLRICVSMSVSVCLCLYVCVCMSVSVCLCLYVCVCMSACRCL